MQISVCHALGLHIFHSSTFLHSGRTFPLTLLSIFSFIASTSTFKRIIILIFKL